MSASFRLWHSWVPLPLFSSSLRWPRAVQLVVYQQRPLAFRFWIGSNNLSSTAVQVLLIHFTARLLSLDSSLHSNNISLTVALAPSIHFSVGFMVLFLLISRSSVQNSSIWIHSVRCEVSFSSYSVAIVICCSRIHCGLLLGPSCCRDIIVAIHAVFSILTSRIHNR